MLIEISSDQVDELVVEELMQTYEHSQEGWYENSEEMQDAIAIILSHYMTPSDYDIWLMKYAQDKLERQKKQLRDLADEIEEGLDALGVTDEK